MKQLYLFFIAAMTYSLSFSQTVTLSHSNNPATVDDGGVSCWNAGSGEYRDNSFFRAYVLSDFIDASSGLEVSAVEFGQGSASEGKAMEVRIYTVTTDNLAMASFTLVTSASFTASSANDLSVVTVPITASIAAGSTIAVEIFAPDHVSHTFFPGINSSGETDDSYIQSAACGLSLIHI